MLLRQKVWVSIPKECGIMRIKEKKMLTRDLKHGARNTVKRGSHRTAQVMQSDVNPRTTGRIVGCIIVCNISHSCNSIIIVKKTFAYIYL